MKTTEKLLPVETTHTWHHFFNNQSYAEFSDGSPRINKNEVLPLSQQIYDLLTGKNLTYMQCWLIIHFAQEALREKRNKTTL